MRLTISLVNAVVVIFFASYITFALPMNEWNRGEQYRIESPQGHHPRQRPTSSGDVSYEPATTNPYDLEVDLPHQRRPRRSQESQLRQRLRNRAYHLEGYDHESYPSAYHGEGSRSIYERRRRRRPRSQRNLEHGHVGGSDDISDPALGHDFNEAPVVDDSEEELNTSSSNKGKKKQTENDSYQTSSSTRHRYGYTVDSGQHSQQHNRSDDDTPPKYGLSECLADWVTNCCPSPDSLRRCIPGPETVRDCFRPEDPPGCNLDFESVRECLPGTDGIQDCIPSPNCSPSCLNPDCIIACVLCCLNLRN